MKIFDLETLSSALYEDLTWRVREISDLRQSIRLSEPSLKNSILRAAIPLVYAHWEGHVKFCATAFVNYVASKRLKLGELKHGYSLGELGADMDRFFAKRKMRIAQIEFLTKIEVASANRFGKGERIVDTKSNLLTDTLCELCIVIGLDSAPFESERSFIDKILVDRRNHIAHGQEISITPEEFENTADRTMTLMRNFNSAVQYGALEERFKRSKAA